MGDGCADWSVRVVGYVGWTCRRLVDSGSGIADVGVESFVKRHLWDLEESK